MPRVYESWYDGIGPRIGELEASLVEQTYAAMEHVAQEAEDYARSNAPWEDRTGDARAGLHADVESEGGVITLTLSHDVDYGIFLELIENGKFAIIMPTLEIYGPKAIYESGGVVTSVRGGY